MGVLTGVRTAVRDGAKSLKSIGIATLVAGTSLVAMPLVSSLTANAVGSTALDPVQSIANIPDSGTCGPNGAGRWVKFTAGGSGSSGTLNSGNPTWTGSYTDVTVGDWRSLTVFDIRDENGQVVYFSAVVIGVGPQNPMWQFAGTNNSGPLDVLRFVDNVGSTLADPAEPNKINFSQLALCAYPYRVLNIQKTVDFNTVPPSATSFSISVSCVPVGGGIPLVYQVVANATASGTIATVPSSVLAPAGSTCTATDSLAGWITTDGVVTMPSASSTTTSATITVTNVKIVPKHILTINKTIIGAFPGDQTSFPVTVACSYNGAAIDLTGNGTPLVVNVPPAASVEVRQDAVCTASEAVIAAHWTTTPSVTQQTTMTAAQSLTFTNTRRTVQVQATKVVNYAGVTNPGDDLTSFPLMLICTNNGASITFPNAPVSANGSIGPVTAPVGATCSVGELLAQADVGDWAVTYNPQTTPPLAANATLMVTNTRRSGRISISKTVTPANAPLPAGGFLFNIDCSPGTAFDVSNVSVSPGSPYLSDLIPTGMSCLVSESDPGSAWTPSPPQTIVVAEGTTANSLTFNNVRNSSDLVITKVATGGPITDFTFTVACVGVGYSGPTTRQVVLTPPAVASATLAGIETGTQCTVTEAAVAGWTLSAITGGAPNLASRSTTLTISSSGNAVTFTNARDRGSLQIAKGIDGGPGGRFTFSLDCPGTESDIAEIEVLVPSGTSTIQPAIPTASGCIITETSHPANYGSAPTQTVDITRGTTLQVTFQNHYIAADVSVTKSDGDVTAVPGTNLVYAMIVKNEDPLGGDTATNVTLSDPIPAGTAFVSVTPNGCALNVGGTAVECTLGSLAPQQSVVVTLTVFVSPTRTGGLTNTVTITAGPNDLNPANDTDTETTPVNKVADLKITKTTLAASAEPGDNVAFTVTVTNNGPSTATDVSWDDTWTGFTSCTIVGPTQPVAALAKDASVNWTATCTAVASDVDIVTNTATITPLTLSANGDPTSGPEGADSATATVPVAKLTFDKTASVAYFNKVGDVITYTFTVTNTGGAILNGITLSDPKINGPYTCSIGGTAVSLPATLPAGNPDPVLTCTAAYVVTNADTTAKSILNVATADSAQTGPATDSVTVPLAALSIIKSVGPVPSGGYVLEAPITYGITVTNTGAMTLTNVTIVDPGADSLGGCTVGASPVTLPLATLAAGNSVTCSAIHLIKQANLDAGTYANTATADSAETPPSSDREVVDLPRNTDLLIVKSVTSAGPYDVGSAITYRIVVTNTGNTTLHTVSVADPTPGVTDFVCVPSTPVAVLLPGAQVQCTAKHVVTAADLIVGHFANVASAQADELEPEFSDVDVVLPPAELTVDKTGPATVISGTTLTYTITVTNTGLVSVIDPVLVDTLPAVGASFTSITAPAGWSCGAPLSLIITCTGPTLLAPGASAMFAVNMLTSAGVPSGTQLLNTATADASNAQPDTDDHTAVVASASAYGITKVANQSATVPGATVSFTITATIYGPSVAQAVTVFDPTPNGLTLTGSTCPDATLDDICQFGDVNPVGGPVALSFTNTYSVGAIGAPLTLLNTATVASTTPEPADDIHPNTATASIPIARMSTVKRVATTPAPPIGGVYKAGDTIYFQIVAENTGAANLTGVTVSDVAAVLGSCAINGAAAPLPTALAVGATLICNATHVLTQIEIDARIFTNIATVTTNQTVPQNPKVDVPLAGAPSISIDKNVVTAGPVTLGATVNYTIVVGNNGTVTLSNVTVSETVGATLGACSVALPTTLAPGQSFSCAATKVISQVDVVAGSAANSATATGKSGNATVTASDTATILTARNTVDLLIVKSLAAPIGNDNIATWRLVVTNNGPGADSGVTIVDVLPTSLTLVSAAGGGWTCTASGKTLTCTYSGSINAGETLPTLTFVTQAVGAPGATVTNTGTVAGTGLDSNLANNSSTASGVLVAVASAAPSPAAPTPSAPTASPLPVTGLNGVLPVTAGGILVILGANLLLIARRRRPVR